MHKLSFQEKFSKCFYLIFSSYFFREEGTFSDVEILIEIMDLLDMHKIITATY